METTMKATLIGKGSGDIACMWDGGSREVRRGLENLANAAQWHHDTELVISYNSPGRRNTGGRSNPFTRQNVEHGYLLTNFPTEEWKVTKRTEFNATGGENTRDSTYSFVPLRSRYSVPLMLAEDRNAMIGKSPIPPAKLFDVEGCGYPWSWHEKKPISWYKVFLQDIKAGLVVDLTPGSGAMARACLENRIQYIGICRTQEHCSWLVNTLNVNRAAVECPSDLHHRPLQRAHRRAPCPGCCRLRR